MGDSLQPGPPPGALEPLLRQAREQRPELRAAELAVRQADEQTAAARAAYNPELYFALMAEGFRGTRTNGFGGGVSGALLASIPLVDGGDRRARVQYARAVAERAKAQVAVTRLSIDRDVARALADMQTQFENIALSEAAVVEAQENYRIARLRLESGKGIQLEVLDAIVTLAQARANRLAALYGYDVARAQLRWSVGTR